MGPLGLAPGGVYLAAPVTRSAGELLPHRFTLTRTSTVIVGEQARSRLGRRPLAVCFLWHCPARRRGWPLATTVALRSPDFPRLPPCGGVPRPPGRLIRVPNTTVVGPVDGGPIDWQHERE